jgi:hypothetical protein
MSSSTIHNHPPTANRFGSEIALDSPGGITIILFLFLLCLIAVCSVCCLVRVSIERKIIQRVIPDSSGRTIQLA